MPVLLGLTSIASHGITTFATIALVPLLFLFVAAIVVHIWGALQSQTATGLKTRLLGSRIALSALIIWTAMFLIAA